jgi:micrococcal nuclease
VTFLCTWLKIGCTAGILSGPATVWDGDTIYVANEPVRLAGIDAEELDEPHGVEARGHLRSLIGASVVTCHWDGYSWKRKVAICYAQDSNRGTLNGSMVLDGFALDCAHYSGGKYRSFEPAGIRLRLIQKPYC